MASPLEMAESVSVEKSPAVILLDNAAARYPTPSSLSRSADSEKNLEPRSSNANHDDNLQQDPEENRLSRAASTISDIDPELILQDQYASTFPQLNLSFFDSDLDFHEASPLIPTLEDIINSSGDSQNQESLRSAGYGECQESAPQISDILIGRTRSKPQSLNGMGSRSISYG
ncbi:hypothetical protein PVAG01_11260 [Phlyctema vagabunda]|uniref:Uncharacterized protein n=1 Tax=Phlyctema vagabunda TaxID=108571 RepID=A0ABR4P1U7_9HELO